jgi:hypothetical protein
MFPYFESCPLSSITFEPPSHLETLILAIPDGFCGPELDVPDSVCRLTISIIPPSQHLLVLHFGRESRLRVLEGGADLSHIGSRRVFARLSEPTLRYFRTFFDGD